VPVRPTLRCVLEDLALSVPSASVPLEEIDHLLLRKASEQFAAEDTPHERIRAIGDVVLLKVKAGRWRGAVYGDDDPGADVRDWLVACGTREEGVARRLLRRPARPGTTIEDTRARRARQHELPVHPCGMHCRCHRRSKRIRRERQAGSRNVESAASQTRAPGGTGSGAAASFPARRPSAACSPALTRARWTR
jgi:hypothetical protein